MTKLFVCSKHGGDPKGDPYVSAKLWNTIAAGPNEYTEHGGEPKGDPYVPIKLWNTFRGFGAKQVPGDSHGLFEVDRVVTDREPRLPFTHPKRGSFERKDGIPLQWGNTIGWRRLLYPAPRPVGPRRHVRPPHRFGKSRFSRRGCLQEVRSRLDRADLYRRALQSSLQNFLCREVRFDARAWTRSITVEVHFKKSHNH